MKKIILGFVLTLLTTFGFSQEVLITGYIDATCPQAKGRTVELYVSGTVNFTDWKLQRQTNGGGFTTPSATIDLSGLGTLTNTFAYVTNDTATLNSEFSISTNLIESSNINSNGDDGFQIVNASNVVIDRFSVDGEDGTGTAWEHLDSYYYRNSGSSANGGSFDVNNWTIGAVNLLDGKGSCNGGTVFSSVVPFGSFTQTVSTDPSLKINSPVDGSTVAFSSTVNVNFAVSNFNVANGGTGNGYIKWKLNDVAQTNKTDTNDIQITVTAGQTYKVSLELVDNSGNSLSPAVTAITNFSVAFPCDLSLSTITTTCDTATSGVDTYRGSIAFSGGNTGVTYTITTDSGTVAGDNPSTTASGTILVTGIQEGQNVKVTIKGDASSSCDYTRTLYSPNCVSLPITDVFDYTAGANLTDQSAWETVNSGDNIVIASSSLDYTGLKASEGNSVTFDGKGSEAYASFSGITAGTVYASFLFKVTAFQTSSSPDLTDGGYFAALSKGTSSYDARVWVRPNPDTAGTTYDIGFGVESSSPPFSSSTYNLNDVVLFVMSYNLDSGEVKAWINPSETSFEATEPTANFTATDSSIASEINTFILRQDSTVETPFIQFDELRLGTTWAEVTPKDGQASTTKNQIAGFAVYPNPVSNMFTLTTASSATKNVSVFNVLGKQVLSEKISGTTQNIGVGNLSSGVYILKVTQEGKVSTQKLVIK